MSILPQPVFLSKQERAELALKRRQEEVDQQRKKMEEEREKRQQYAREAQGKEQILIGSTLSTFTDRECQGRPTQRP